MEQSESNNLYFMYITFTHIFTLNVVTIIFYYYICIYFKWYYITRLCFHILYLYLNYSYNYKFAK